MVERFITVVWTSSGRAPMSKTRRSQGHVLSPVYLQTHSHIDGRGANPVKSSGGEWSLRFWWPVCVILSRLVYPRLDWYSLVCPVGNARNSQ